MSEKIPTLKNEAVRESGLVVPGEYTEGNNPTPPEIILPTEQEVRLYNKSRNETKEEKAEIADRQAYEEIIKPINVLHLKEAIDHAQGELGTKSANVNSGRNLSKEASAIREEYIAEYLQTGNKRDLPRPIPHEIRTQLEDLLKMSYKQLEALLGESEENQENIQPDDEPENSTENEPKPDNGPEDSPPKKRPKKGPSSPDSGAAAELDIPKSENGNSQEKQADQEPEPDDSPEDEPDGNDDPEDELEEEPIRKYGADEIDKKHMEYRDKFLNRLQKADSLTDKQTRTDAIIGLAREVMKGKDADLSILAADVLKNSQVHKGRRARRLGNTKKFGEMYSSYNSLLNEIAVTNIHNELSLKAADMVDHPVLRNKALKDVSVLAAKEYRKIDNINRDYINTKKPIKDLMNQHSFMGDLNWYDDLVKVSEVALKMIKQGNNISINRSKTYDRVARHEIAQSTGDTSYLSGREGLRRFTGFMEKQRTLEQAAIEARDLTIAKKIVVPHIRKRATKAIEEKVAKYI